MTATARFLLGAALAVLPAQVAGDVTVPVWTKPDQFWYRRTVQGGDVWVNVDARHGVREPLFDHKRLAIELTLRSGTEYTPLTLPFADPAAQFVVKYDGSNAYIQEGAMAIEFVLGGQQWRCDLQIKWDWNRVPPTDYECLPRRSASDTTRASVAPGDVPRVSPDGRWEAFVKDHNVGVRATGASAGGPAMLTSDGTAASAYQPGSIRWSADSKSVSAYRVSAAVWTSDALTGNVKTHIARGEWRVEGTR